MRNRISLIFVAAFSVLSLLSVLTIVRKKERSDIVLDELNPFGSVEDVTLPVQVGM